MRLYARKNNTINALLNYQKIILPHIFIQPQKIDLYHYELSLLVHFLN